MFCLSGGTESEGITLDNRSPFFFLFLFVTIIITFMCFWLAKPCCTVQLYEDEFVRGEKKNLFNPEGISWSQQEAVYDKARKTTW